MLKEIIQHLQEGVLIIDAETSEMVFANEKFLELTNMDQDYVGKKCYEVLLDQDSACDHCLKAREIQDVCRNVRNLTGASRFTLKGYNFTENGKKYHVEFMMDRTETYNALRASDESTQTLLVALDHSNLIFWEYDFEKRCCKRGERYLELIGGPAIAENIPADIDKTHIVVKADIPKLKRLYSRLLNGEDDVADEMRINYLSGVQWGKIRLTTIYDDKHNRIKAVGTIENTQLSKEMEESLAIVSEQNKMRLFTYDFATKRAKFYKTKRKGKVQELDLGNSVEYLRMQEKIHPLDLHILQNTMEKLTNGQEHEEIVIRIQEKDDGEFNYYALAFTITWDTEGKPDKLLGTCREINEQVKKERSYKSQLAYMDNYKRSSIAYVEIEVDKNKLDNVKTKYPSLRKGVDGHSIENWAELLCRNTLTEEGKKTILDSFNQENLRTRFERGYTRFKIVIPFQLQPDYKAWLGFNTTLLLNPATSRLEGYVYVSDETERKQSEAITNSIVEVSYEVVVIVDMYTGEIADRYMFSNQFRNTLVNHNYYQESSEEQKRFVVEEDKERLFDNFRIENLRDKMLTLGKYTDYFSVRGNDGKLYRKKVVCSRLNGFDSKMMITIQDISDIYFGELEKQNQLTVALKKAEEAAAVKTEFLSRMSHDIRTPLNGVLGMARIAMEETGEKNIKEYLEKIMVSGQLLISLVNDILDITKIEGHKMELHPQSYSMQEFVELVENVIGEQCRQKRQVFEIQADELKDLYIQVDKLRFNQIFINLLSNAVKYTPEYGTISFRTKIITGTERIKKVQFIVEDNGQGMSSEFLKNAFDAFAQESVAITARRDGSGLGLAIVKQLVDLMNGTIELESEVDEGTKATVVLNVLLSEEHNSLVKNEVDTSVLAGKRILIAEDQPMNVMIVQKILGKWDIETEVAENGVRAVQMYQESPLGYYSGIMMDIRMPIMDGMEATRIIRSSTRADRNLPIVAMTANAFADDRKASMDAGMNAHLAKPINPDEVFATFSALIK